MINYIEAFKAVKAWIFKYDFFSFKKRLFTLNMIFKNGTNHILNSLIKIKWSRDTLINDFSFGDKARPSRYPWDGNSTGF